MNLIVFLYVQTYAFVLVIFKEKAYFQCESSYTWNKACVRMYVYSYFAFLIPVVVQLLEKYIGYIKMTFICSIVILRLRII